MNENEPKVSSMVESQMLFSNLLPNMNYFESRFEIMQNNYDEVRRNQDNFKDQLRDLKTDMDRRFFETREDMKERFAQVDKRFEQVDKRFEQVDKRFEQVDKRFEQVDKRLEQILSSIEKIGEKMDHRDDRQRKFTLRMFSIAMSFTGLSVLGVLIKVLNVI
jgi:chromosome segregation ATPase